MDKVRIDKWLWAARFFKTRSLAKQAIDGGKVHCDGQKVKASREIVSGQQLKIRQGFDEKEVEVLALSDKRRGAPEAALLYRESESSINKREMNAAERKAIRGNLTSEHRPSKKQRRLIHKFKEDNRFQDE